MCTRMDSLAALLNLNRIYMAHTADLRQEYVVACTCGHDIKVKAETREDAVAQMKKMMDKDGILEHFRKYHSGELVPPVAEIYAHIEQDIEEVLVSAT